MDPNPDHSNRHMEALRGQQRCYSNFPATAANAFGSFPTFPFRRGVTLFPWKGL